MKYIRGRSGPSTRLKHNFSAAQAAVQIMMSRTTDINVA